ncbi:MAG TPA: hypothetical protein DCM41_05335 [Synergistaceae bacterium]|nr:hypothetical protein [Synergistaceae bacterium]
MKYLFDAVLIPSERMERHDCRLIVDLLRASTQITTFFDCGGSSLIPCTGKEEALEIKREMGPAWMLMGERDGIMIPGFDFGNSPVEITRRGAPENAVITTSNGTKALLAAAEDCPEVRVACARNAEAAAWDAICSGRHICVVASGRNGRFSIEDTVCAGMIIEKMLAMAPSNGGTEMELTDGAITAMALWHHFGPDLVPVCMESEHGKILQELGFAEDIFFCGENDSSAVVPYYRKDGKYGSISAR